MSQYFPKPFNSRFGDSIKVNIDLSNYATKADITNISHFDTSSFALKANLASLKTEVDKLDIDKLKPVPTDLSKLSNVVKNDVVKKDVHKKLVAKVDNIDTSDFVLKTNYDTKINGLEIKIRDISNLATKTALTTVENKMPDDSSLVKKTDYNTKIDDIENKLNDHNHHKYIDTSEFNTLASNFFNARLAQANLITKTDFDAKLLSFNKKNTNNKSKHLRVENKLTTLETKIPDVSSLVKKTDYNTKVAEIDGKISSLEDKITKNIIEGVKRFITYKSRSIFDAEDGTQAYLIFQPIHKYIKTTADTKLISEWKSKGLSDESIKPFLTSNNSLTPLMDYYGGYYIRVNFNGSILKQTKVTYTHKKAVNI